jgi:23S rRNA pseudouridine2605 synthase
VRLAKYLAHAGVASRRAAEDIVRAGRVTVGGETVTDPARDVDETSRVAVDGRGLRGAEERTVYMVNKPRGVVSTAKDTHGRSTVVSLIRGERARLYPVGRLDADTTGLILLTNDGELANTLTHPRFQVPKTYIVEVTGGFVPEARLRQLREGIELEDGKTAPAQVRQVDPGVLQITIREGKKRQVRRMIEAVGRRVISLRRVRFGPLGLGDLAPGKSRKLTPAEVERLRKTPTA